MTVIEGGCLRLLGHHTLLSKQAAGIAVTHHSWLLGTASQEGSSCVLWMHHLSPYRATRQQTEQQAAYQHQLACFSVNYCSAGG